MTATAAYVREQMVSNQLRTWDVLDEGILDAVRSLPREAFVPPAWRDLAYADVEIPLPLGQHMLAPKIVGRILQSVGARVGERVLEVGTGSGYLTACLGRLGAQVVSLEIHGEIAAAARKHLQAVGLDGPRVIEADGFAYASSGETFDVVVLTGSMPVYDARFEARLAPGGRLFVVVGQGPAMQARLITRESSGGRTQRGLFETEIDPLVNAPRLEAFRF